MTIERLIEIKNSQKKFEPIHKSNQVFIVMREAGVINPESLDDYIGADGFFALQKVLNLLSSDEVISIITNSGLRGRGGAGFSTGKKWELAKNNSGAQKFVICNGDEGDPGAFMDRAIMEQMPFKIVEAMAIAGYSIGASKGIIFVRAEYPVAFARLKNAIDVCKQNGLLGSNIFNSDFCFDIEIKLGAGAFVCGEETSLIRACEGKRGEPVQKPPYPAQKGYMGCPTIINNVETLANIPIIIRNGCDWFKNTGVPTSTGTKVFSLTGKVNNVGLVEVPMGTTLRQLVYDIGGGIVDNKKLKAVQLGGPSGGCIPENLLDTPVDYDSLKKVGAMVGSGGLVVMDEDTCMVDVAKFFLNFTKDESCGKCTPCRVGNTIILQKLEKICNSKGSLNDLNELQDLCEYVINNSLCGLGQSSPNPVLSTLKYFKDEYIEHVVNKKCRAGVCKNLIKFKISKSKCVGCLMCFNNCPVNAISKDEKRKCTINQKICVKCGLCYKKCRFSAISKGGDTHEN